MNPIEDTRDVLIATIAARLRLPTDHAQIWASDLREAGFSLDLCHAAVKAVAQSVSGRPVSYADVYQECVRRREAERARTETEGRLALASGERRHEVASLIARCAAAVGLSGRVGTKTEAEVRDEMRALYREPEALRERLAEIDVLSSPVERGRALARQILARAPELDPDETQRRNEEIARDWTRSEDGRWVRR